MKEKEIISEFFRKIAKRTHKLKPQSKEHYKRIQKLAVKKRLQNKAKKERNLTDSK